MTFGFGGYSFLKMVLVGTPSLKKGGLVVRRWQKRGFPFSLKNRGFKFPTSLTHSFQVPRSSVQFSILARSAL